MDAASEGTAPHRSAGKRRRGLPAAWRRLAAGRLLLVLLFGLYSVAYIALQALMQRRSGLPPETLREDVMIALVGMFVVLQLHQTRRNSRLALDELRPVVRISDARFDGYAQRLLSVARWIEWALLGVAVVAFIVLFAAPADELSGLARTSPLDWAVLALLGGYLALAIWLGLSLIYSTLRSAIALAGLAKSPLAVNIFDIESLLPFGRVALVHSLTSVGLVLIPMLILGPPAEAGFLVIGISAISLAVLIVPLLGVHEAIVAERKRLLASVDQELMRVQETVAHSAAAENAQLRALYERVELLMGFRKHVLAGPTWPFRDNYAVVRVLAAVLSPAFIALIDLIVEKIVFPLITRGTP